MRIVLATVGSLGDLHPYIAIALALRDRGAQPVIASVPEYAADVEREGIEFAPVGPGFAPFGDYRKLVEKIFDVRRGTQFIVREIVMPNLALAYAGLDRAVDGADVLVSHPLTVTAPLVAEKRGLRWAATVLAPMNLMSMDDPPLIAGAQWLRALHAISPAVYRAMFRIPRWMLWRWEAPLRDLRRQLGLPPTRKVALLEGQYSPHLNLGLFDAVLAKPQPDWPHDLRITGAPLHDGVLADRRELDAFLDAGDAPLVFALGSSAVWVAGDFWQHAVAAARMLGRRAILVVGPAQPGELGPDVRAFAYLPYSAVFPRGAAVIHQAGIGTLSQAMRSGRPQLIVPFAFDQPDNARRAAGLGVARVLPAGNVTASTLASELRALLADGAYAERAAIVARELRETHGAARAAGELMRIAPC